MKLFFLTREEYRYVFHFLQFHTIAIAFELGNISSKKALRPDEATCLDWQFDCLHRLSRIHIVYFRIHLNSV